MKASLSSVLLLLIGAIVVASGCRKLATVSNDPQTFDAGVAGASGSSGSGGALSEGGAMFVMPVDGGTADGCPSSCDALHANCGFVTDTRCGGVVKCDVCTGTDVCGGTEP